MNAEENVDFSGLTKQDLLDRFEEMETKYKTDGSPEGYQNVLNIFNFASKEDMVPQNVHNVYTADWKAYCLLRQHLQEDHEISDDDADDLQDRFSRFQECLFYCRDTMLSFMRMTNCNAAFPVPKNADMIFWHAPLNTEDLKPMHLFTIYILGSLFRHRYRRFEGRVFEQIFLNGNPTHAWKDKCDIKAVVRSFCAKESNFDMWKIMMDGVFENVVKYLTECQDIEFPDLKIKRRVWSFNDGIYDATDDKFWFYGSPMDETIVSCKIIEKDFAPAYFRNLVNGVANPGGERLAYEDLDTPFFDSIFAPQNWDPIMIKWMFVWIGRLFYEVNEKDSWQVIPFLKGVAGTGKSTVIKIVQLLYAAKDVGVISNNIEQKFGLATIFNKTIFIIPELKGNFSIDQGDLQSMITGEDVSVAVKHGDPCVGRWVVPGIMAGNEAANWEDKSGSISRRIVVMDFPNKIPQDKLDPNLFTNIKNTEIPMIIRKATLAYNWAVENYGKSDVWTALPERVCAEKKKLQFSTNPLYAFVNSDRIEIHEDEYTLESIFISQLKVFANLKFPGVTFVFNEDFYSYIFADYGVRVENCTKNWPRNSQNAQRQTYITGLKVIVG